MVQSQSRLPFFVAPAKPVGTTDMDFLIPRKPAVPAKAESVSKALGDLGFSVRQKNTGSPPIESYVKESGDMV